MGNSLRIQDKAIARNDSFAYLIVTLHTGVVIGFLFAKQPQIIERIQNGDTQVYRGDNATGIVQVWSEAYTARSQLREPSKV